MKIQAPQIFYVKKNLSILIVNLQSILGLNPNGPESKIQNIHIQISVIRNIGSQTNIRKTIIS